MPAILTVDDSPTVSGRAPGIGRTAARHTRSFQGWPFESGLKVSPSIVSVTPETTEAIVAGGGSMLMSPGAECKGHASRPGRGPTAGAGAGRPMLP
jgi:hypothetical protein